MRMTPRVIVKKLIRRWSIPSSARCCDRHALLMISWFTTISQKNVSDNGSDWCSDTTRRRPILFNIYTNDQPIRDGTRNFIYADDLCVTAQYSSFTEVKTTIGEALEKLTQYYRSNSLRANPDKTHKLLHFI